MKSDRRPRRFVLALRDRQVWRRTLILGLPVGLMQAALNQGDHWYHHAVTPLIFTKTILCPVLSCAIAFASAAVNYGNRNLDLSSP